MEATPRPDEAKPNEEGMAGRKGRAFPHCAAAEPQVEID